MTKMICWLLASNRNVQVFYTDETHEPINILKSPNFKRPTFTTDEWTIINKIFERLQDTIPEEKSDQKSDELLVMVIVVSTKTALQKAEIYFDKKDSTIITDAHFQKDVQRTVKLHPRNKDSISRCPWKLFVDGFIRDGHKRPYFNISFSNPSTVDAA